MVTQPLPIETAFQERERLLRQSGEYLTTEEVERILGISPTTLRRRIHARVLTPAPRPATIGWAPNYYRREDILRLLGTAPTTATEPVDHELLTADGEASGEATTETDVS